MGEEFYAVLKLVSGEEIFSLVSVDENDGDTLLVLQNPIIMKIFNTDNGVFVKIKPWMEIPNDDIYIIKLDKIITMTEIKDDNMIYYYQKYLLDNNDDLTELKSGKVKISDKMGYISTVEDARKNLEDIFKRNTEA